MRLCHKSCVKDGVRANGVKRTSAKNSVKNGVCKETNRARYEHRLHYHWSQLERDRIGNKLGSPARPRPKADRYLRLPLLRRRRRSRLVVSLQSQARFRLCASIYKTPDYNTFSKNGVMKLTEVEMYFMSLYITKATVDQWFVIYLGVGNGERFRYLRDEFFPGLAIVAFDPLDAFFEGCRPEVERNAAKWNNDGTNYEFLLRCFDEDKDCDWLRERYPGRKILLISDIRGINLHEDSYNFDKACDNEIQLKAVQRLQPVASLLKFAVPDWDTEHYWYAPGKFLKQVFCYYSTCELRLLVEGVPQSLVRYNVQELLDGIVDHHERLRGQVYRSTRQPGRCSGGLCYCFDCTVLWDTVRFYAARNSVDPYQVLESITKNHLYQSHSDGFGIWGDVTFYLDQGRIMEAAAALHEADNDTERDWSEIPSSLPQQPDIAKRLQAELPRPASRADVLRAIGTLANPFTLVRTGLNGLIAHPPWSWQNPRGMANRANGDEAAEEDHAVDMNYYKKEPCWFYLNGRCSKGRYCTFSHGEGDNLTVSQQTPPCWWFASGMCTYGDGCYFRHEFPGQGK